MRQRKENKEHARKCLETLRKAYDPANIAGDKPPVPDVETFIVDMLADLRHLCDLFNLPFAEVDRHAYGHYNEERNGAR